MGKDTGIHPAIVELRRYLHQKGDVNLVAYMQRWMASWLDVAYFKIDFTGEEMQTLREQPKEKQEQFLEALDKRAFQQLGVTIGPQAAVKEEEPHPNEDYTTHQYSVMVLRHTKKPLLESQ